MAGHSRAGKGGKGRGWGSFFSVRHVNRPQWMNVTLVFKFVKLYAFGLLSFVPGAQFYQNNPLKLANVWSRKNSAKVISGVVGMGEEYSSRRLWDVEVVLGERAWVHSMSGGVYVWWCVYVWHMNGGVWRERFILFYFFFIFSSHSLAFSLVRIFQGIMWLASPWFRRRGPLKE